MRKLFYISLVLTIALIVWLLIKQSAPKPMQPQPTNLVVDLPPQQLETNPVEYTPNTSSSEKVSQPTNIIQPTVPPVNVLTATNIEQWKAAINGLHKMRGLSESWDMEMENLTSSVPVNLEENGKAVSFKAQFIDISIKNENGDILEAQLHSPIMNIDETKELGLQLCNMLQIDPKNFLAWCDKVGNNWLDQPLFGDGDGHHHYSFHILRGYNDEKPWLINFMIIPNP